MESYSVLLSKISSLGSAPHSRPHPTFPSPIFPSGTLICVTPTQYSHSWPLSDLYLSLKLLRQEKYNEKQNLKWEFHALFFSFWPSFPWFWNGWSSRSSKKTETQKNISGNGENRSPASPRTFHSADVGIKPAPALHPNFSRAVTVSFHSLIWVPLGSLAPIVNLAPNPINFSLKCLLYLYLYL